MSENGGGMAMVMVMMMGLSMSMVSLIAAAVIGLIWYNEYQKNSGAFATVTGDWTDTTMTVPQEARGDTDENCVYFYDHGTNWDEGDGTSGTLKNSGRWCIADGVDTHVPIWDAKGQRGELKHDSVDYIRLGKNLNLTVWDNHNKKIGTDFRGSGTSKTVNGASYGVRKLLHAKNTVGQDNIDAFMISTP